MKIIDSKYPLSLLFIFLISAIFWNCINKENKKNWAINDETLFMKDNVPNFELEPGDTIIYLLKESVQSIVPFEYEYRIESKFQLIGIGDSILESANFNYLTIDWVWIKNEDTIKISTFKNNVGLIDSDKLLKNTLNIEYGSSDANATNWEEFYSNIINDINSIIDKPKEVQPCLLEFYNTMFNSNWIRAKIRQVFIFGPYYCDTFEPFEIGKKWTYNLPIEYEAKSLHPVANVCTIDSIAQDIIVASISGELYGQPPLVNPNCINGSLIIDRQKRKLSYFNITQHMESEDIPSLSYEYYSNRFSEKSNMMNDDHDLKNQRLIKEIKYERILNVELILIN